MPKPKRSGLDESTNKERKDRRAEGHFKSLDQESYSNEDKFFENMVKEFLKNTTFDEKDGITYYTGKHYQEINEYLRKGKYGSGEDKELERIIDNITSGLSKFKLDKDMTFYRKSGSDLFKKIIGSELGIKYNNAQQFIDDVNSFANTVVRDKGFTSSSTQSTKWDGKVHMEIRTPSGTKGAFVKPISHFESEREFLFNRGTYYKIIGAKMKYDKYDGNVPLVTLQVVRSGRHNRKKLGKKA